MESNSNLDALDSIDHVIRLIAFPLLESGNKEPCLEGLCGINETVEENV